MKLHLVRHAKTEAVSTTGKDFDRRLLNKGVIQANVLGYYLQWKKVEPVFTWVSDARRTRETAQIILNALPLGKITIRHELYLCDREDYLRLIWEENHQSDLLIIGHNDGISELASYLSGTAIHLKTSGYICLEFSEAETWQEVSRDTGVITDQFRPAVLSLAAPDENGK